MEEHKVKIRMNPLQARDFVDQASKCNFDIDISYNHYTIDAKSLVGVMGLDFRVPLTVVYTGHNDEFENYVSSLVIA